MKILLINDYKQGGGAEVVFHKMYQLLTANGIEVDTFIGTNNLKSNNRTIVSYIYNLNSAKNLECLFHKSIYDKVIILNYSAVLSPSILRTIKKYKDLQNFKVIYNAHDEHLICPNSGLNYFKNGKMFRFGPYSSMSAFIFKQLDYRGHLYSLLKKIQWIIAYKILCLHKVIDLIVTPSNFLKERIELFYPEFKCKLLRNPCLKKIEKIYSSPQSSETPLKMVFIGRLSQEKGIEQFIKSLKELDYNYQFDIFGTGDREKFIQKLIGSSTKINLKGQVSHDQLMSLLPNYEVLVLPSLMYENAPMSIVEAASYNLKILTMNYGGMKELADYVGNSVCMDNHSKKEISRGLNIIRLLNDRETDLSEFTEISYLKNLIEILY